MNLNLNAILLFLLTVAVSCHPVSAQTVAAKEPSGKISPELQMANQLELANLQAKLQEMTSRCDTLRKQAEDARVQHRDAQSLGKISSYLAKAQKLEAAAAGIESQMTPLRARHHFLQMQLGGPPAGTDQTGTTGAPLSPSPIKEMARYKYRDGKFEPDAKGNPLQWTETSTDGKIHWKFLEIRRNAEFIFIYDKGRGYTVSLPIKGGMSFLSVDGEKNWQNLYQVSRESMDTGGSKLPFH